MAYPYPYSPYGGYSPYQPMNTQPMNIPTQLPAMAQTSPQATAQGGYNCRPVTSREEAVALQVDFFSMGTLMPDLAHNVVYLKRLNQQTGGSDFFTFALQQPKEPEKPEYVTREEFEAFCKSFQINAKRTDTEVGNDE